MKGLLTLLSGLALMLTACAESGTSATPTDTVQPISTWSRIQPEGNLQCANGTPFSFWVRPGTENKLLLWFQGGGMCWNGDTCQVKDGYNHFVTGADYMANLGGIFDFEHDGNPFASYDVVFVPYCTGDLHWGNRTKTYQKKDGNKFSIYHKGYVNAHAALKWVYENYPDPASVFVSGRSSGAVGSILHAAQVARHYPDAMVSQLGDSAILTPPFNFNGTYVEGPREDFPPNCDRPENLIQNLPEHFSLSQFYVAVAKCNPGRTFSQFTFADDKTQKNFYRYLQGEQAPADDLSEAIRNTLHTIDRVTDNFFYFTVPGTRHTVFADDAFYTIAVDGKPLSAWVQDLAEKGTVTRSFSGTTPADLEP